jgi:hypothetical protein
MPWLTDEAVEAMLKEYRSRSAADLRVSEAARGLLRTVVESNAATALALAARGAPKPGKKGGKRRPVTASLIAKAGEDLRLSV